ncbi:MAG: hypothetical protein JSW20_05395 [Nitrospiraceae bacterium]|nr:MAG: hypothetical protein JSW20_05395 [Nitrospiraceae bacterium]
MINEISNKIPAFNNSRKSDVKNTAKATSSGPELYNRSHLNQPDTIEISPYQTVDVPAEKIIAPVQGHDNDVHLPPDINQKESNAEGSANPDIQEAGKNSNAINGQTELTEEEQKEIADLQKLDAEVRQHENAHIAAAGAYAHGVSFVYQAGPDGRRYAVGGEVSIDTSPVHDNLDATIAKAQTIRAAANAPAEPSPRDRQVAAAATRMETAARAEKMRDLAEGRESAEVNVQNTDNKTPTGDIAEKQYVIQSAEESSLVDALTEAYGKKETGIGKIIRLTV